MELEAKSLVLFVILPLCVLAALAAFALRGWKEVKEIDVRQAEEARAEAAAKEAERAKKEKEEAVARRPLELVSEGEGHESRQDWSQALTRYEESLGLADRVETKARIRAIRHIQTAVELEKEKKWAEALEAYRLAAPDCANKTFVQQRVQYCTHIEPYLKAYEEGKSAEAASEWEKALAAYDRARDLAGQGGIASDVEQRIAVVRPHYDKGLGQQRQVEARMNRVLRMLAEQRKHRAVALACAFYAASPDHAKFAPAIEAARGVAMQAIDADRAANPLKKESRTFDFIKLKDGKERRGKVVEKYDTGYKVDLMERVEKKTVMIALGTVDGVEQREVLGEQLLDEEATTMLERALELLRQKPNKALEAAELIGLVCLDHESVAFAKSEARQREVFRAKASELVDKLGDTMAQARKQVVPVAEEGADFIAHLCGGCEGNGAVICPRCEGKGEVNGPCPQCGGAKQVQCRTCGGQGQVRCRKCGGDGQIQTVRKGRDNQLNPVEIREQRPCDACGASGRARCGDCRGTRMVGCRQCKATGLVPVDCPQCKAQKKVECPTCKGQGRLSCQSHAGKPCP